MDRFFEIAGWIVAGILILRIIRWVAMDLIEDVAKMKERLSQQKATSPPINRTERPEE